jgi:hypothetical protein
MHVVVLDPIVHELLELGDCCEPDVLPPAGRSVLLVARLAARVVVLRRELGRRIAQRRLRQE